MNHFERYTIGAILGALLILTLTFSLDLLRKPYIPLPPPPTPTTAIQAAAADICLELLRMYEAREHDAIAGLGLVRCAVLEELRAGSISNVRINPAASRHPIE